MLLQSGSTHELMIGTGVSKQVLRADVAVK